MTYPANPILCLLAIALFAAPHAHAGNVFKCKDASGGTVYQNHACDGSQETLAHREFEAAPAAPAKPTHTYREIQSTPQGDSSRTAERSKYPQVSRPPAAGQASGYQCNDGSRQWISDKPCPRTATRYYTERVTTGSYNGVPSYQNVRSAETTAVTQRGLDSRQLCQQVNAGTRTSNDDEAGAADGYERNKMRDKKGC